MEIDRSLHLSTEVIEEFNFQTLLQLCVAFTLLLTVQPRLSSHHMGTQALIERRGLHICGWPADTESCNLVVGLSHRFVSRYSTHVSHQLIESMKSVPQWFVSLDLFELHVNPNRQSNFAPIHT